MKVVFPSPDSPATYRKISEWTRLKSNVMVYHNCESSSSLCDNFMSLIWQIGNANRRGTFNRAWSHYSAKKTRAMSVNDSVLSQLRCWEWCWTLCAMLLSSCNSLVFRRPNFELVASPLSCRQGSSPEVARPKLFFGCVGSGWLALDRIIKTPTIAKKSVSISGESAKVHHLTSFWTWWSDGDNEDGVQGRWFGFEYVSTKLTTSSSQISLELYTVKEIYFSVLMELVSSRL